MEKKYIINSGTQSLNSNITINGDMYVSGTITAGTISTGENPIGVYRALLTHVGSITGSNILDFNYGLIKNEFYTLTNYVEGDDFSNIAISENGTPNQTGDIFLASGETPKIWTNGSLLTSSGGVIVDVLENTLGFDISWQDSPYDGTGYYIGVPMQDIVINSFPRRKTDIKVGIKPPIYHSRGSERFSLITPFSGIDSSIEKDAYVFLEMYTHVVVDGGFLNPVLTEELVSNSLYYTPIEIRINKDLDTTPITVYGVNVSSFPYGDTSLAFYAGSNEIITFDSSENYQVSDINALVNKLNQDEGTSFLGTFSVNENTENGMLLTVATNFKNKISPDDTLTFQVYGSD